MYHGIINVYKEAGFTSHDVVAKLRGICKQKKIGHTGTLDPDAVGVLPVCLGSGTKLCDMLTGETKEYIARFRLGMTTDTQDISGKILEEKEVGVCEEQVKEMLSHFVGELQQVPPMYSALKVGGKKLYELAREGKEVERKARPVTIYELELLKAEHPEYEIRVVCSKGTYIRTLCHDVGQALSCGAVMTSLVRSRVGEFRLRDAKTLSALQELADQGRLQEAVIPVEEMFHALPAIQVSVGAQKALLNGNQLKRSEVLIKEDTESIGKRPEEFPVDQKEYRVYSSGGRFCAIYRYEGGRRLFTPVKMFLEGQDGSYADR